MCIRDRVCTWLFLARDYLHDGLNFRLGLRLGIGDMPLLKDEAGAVLAYLRPVGRHVYAGPATGQGHSPAAKDSASNTYPGPVPVSYTHLDVYKRQLYAFTGEKPKRRLPSIFQSIAISEVIPGVGKNNPPGPLAAAVSVSYTHLDVYKRQNLPC